MLDKGKSQSKERGCTEEELIKHLIKLERVIETFSKVLHEVRML